MKATLSESFRNSLEGLGLPLPCKLDHQLAARAFSRTARSIDRREPRRGKSIFIFQVNSCCTIATLAVEMKAQLSMQGTEQVGSRRDGGSYGLLNRSRIVRMIFPDALAFRKTSVDLKHQHRTGRQSLPIIRFPSVGAARNAIPPNDMVASTYRSADFISFQPT